MSEIKDYIEKENKIIAQLVKKYPKDFLVYEHIFLEANINELIPIGIFKCVKCSRPINHHQYMFSTLCSGCDIGKTNPKWIIKVPEKEYLSKDEIRDGLIRAQNLRLKDVDRIIQEIEMCLKL